MANGRRKAAGGAVIQGSFVGGRFTPSGVAVPPNPHINQHSTHLQRTVQAKMVQPRAVQPRGITPPVVQRHGTGEAFQLPAHLSSFGGSSGQPLPAAVRQKMESFFSTSFGDVRVHVGSQASAIGALAFTQGSNLYFAQGQYNPNTPRGQQILAHELTHVVQQRAGRVRNPFGSGVAVVQDRSMEAEAERMGHLAALHKEKTSTSVAVGPNSANRGTGQNAVQPMLWAAGLGVAAIGAAAAYYFWPSSEDESGGADDDGGSNGGSGRGAGGGGGKNKGKTQPKKKVQKSNEPSPLELLKREARREGAERGSDGWPLYARGIKARLATHGSGADKVVREAFMEGASQAHQEAQRKKPPQPQPKKSGGGGGGGGGRSADTRANETVQMLLTRVRNAIGKYDVYGKKDANVRREGCVKNGPSEFVDRDIKQEVYDKLRAMEGDEFQGGWLHLVTKGKNPPTTYDLTLHGDYNAFNPQTMVILHVES
jgi:hypothetical protein